MDKTPLEYTAQDPTSQTRIQNRMVTDANLLFLRYKSDGTLDSELQQSALRVILENLRELTGLNEGNVKGPKNKTLSDIIRLRARYFEQEDLRELHSNDPNLAAASTVSYSALPAFDNRKRLMELVDQMVKVKNALEAEPSPYKRLLKDPKIHSVTILQAYVDSEQNLDSHYSPGELMRVIQDLFDVFPEMQTDPRSMSKPELLAYLIEQRERLLQPETASANEEDA